MREKENQDEVFLKKGRGWDGDGSGEKRRGRWIGT